jgi:alanine or glycine:cation symporter, AGCS family
MKKLLSGLFLALLCFSGLLAAQAPAVPASEIVAPTIDQRIENAVKPVAGNISNAIFYNVCWPKEPGGKAFGFAAKCDDSQSSMHLILIWLIACAVICTLYFRFINIRGFAHGFKLIRGDYVDKSSPGEVSHFQALTSAVSGTVGLGNIAGVAVAVSVGGPGATFWMIVAGLLGMSTKFTECSLGVMYRRENADGTISGGPMHYLSRGIAANYPKLKYFGLLLGGVSAVCTMAGAIGAGAMFQANQAFMQFVNVTGGEASPLARNDWAFGLVLVVLVGVVIVGGIARIGQVTEKLVPAMALLYLSAGLVVLAVNFQQLPDAVMLIINSAFSTEAAYGGIVGAIIQGFRRAAFSNEAGLGSAAIAHSAVKTREPMTEGFVALWEPFIDTVVICTMTALVIVVTGEYTKTGMGGVELTSDAFSTVISWFPYVLTVAVFLFAYSTMITWGYYGVKAMGFLTNENKIAQNIFKLVFLLSLIVGCVLDLNSIVDIADAMIFTMAIPNIIGLYLLLPVVKRELVAYQARLKSGEIKSSRA